MSVAFKPTKTIPAHRLCDDKGRVPRVPITLRHGSIQHHAYGVVITLDVHHRAYGVVITVDDHYRASSAANPRVTMTTPGSNFDAYRLN